MVKTQGYFIYVNTSRSCKEFQIRANLDKLPLKKGIYYIKAIHHVIAGE